MKTLVQQVFGNSINSESAALSAFPNSKLQLEQVTKEIKKKLEQKRASEMTDDQKIAMAIAALRAKSRKSSSSNPSKK